MNNSKTTCDRFEREGLLQLEAGEPLDSHFETCQDCLQARADYEQLAADLSALGSEDEPPADWQAQTWNRIDARQKRSSLRPRVSWLAPLVAAAAVTFLILRTPTPLKVPDRFEVFVESGSGVSRSLDAKPGDRLVLRGPTHDAVYAELRVYRDDRELILHCSTEPPCQREAGVLAATIELPTVGRYQAVLLLSESPLPEPTGDGLSSDAASVLILGAGFELGGEIDVR